MANKMRKRFHCRLDLRQLPGAAGGEEKYFAGVDAVHIADTRIRVGDAGCVGGTAELGLCNLGERVAGPHGELGGGPNRRNRGRQNNLRASHDLIRVENARIDDDQFMPARPVSKVLLREFPE